MKRTILFLICLWVGVGLQAQSLSISGDGKTAVITGSTAGCLTGTTVISAIQKTTITSLTITGQLDASDIKVMRDNMTVLADLDLSGAAIVAYTGTGGPASASSTVYAANFMPNYSFCTTGNIGKATLRTFKTPATLTSFGTNVFYGCGNMTSVNIPSSVTTIGANAFYGCSADIAVDPANTYFSFDENGILYGCTSSVKTSIIGASSSSSYAGIDYTVPSTVTSVAAYVFGYSNLHSVTFTSNVTLGTNLFQKSNVAAVTISAAITTIANNVFINNPTLLTVAAGNPNYSSDANGILYNKAKTTLISAPVLNSLSTFDLVVPSSVTNIYQYAFYGCYFNSVSVTSATTIGNYAFANSFIPSISITSNVTTMGTYIFNYATISSMTLTSLSIIGGYDFTNCLLPSLTLPASVTTIGGNAFFQSGTKITVDAANPNYSSDEFGALYNKDKSTLIVAPTSLLGSYVIPNTVTSVLAAFYSTKLTSITIPSSVTSIAGNAFTNVSSANLTQIHAQGATPPTLGTAVFSGLLVSKVTIYVKDMAAASAYKAAAQWTAFPAVRELPVVIDVTTPGTLTSLLRTEEKTTWTGLIVTGVLDATDFKYINGMTKLTTLDLGGVTSIAAYTGTGGPVATSTSYPENEFPQYSLNVKTLITSVVLPPCLKSIGQYALKGTAITSITIPDAVTTIDAYTFNACTALKTVHLPTSLNSISNMLFNGCTSLTTVNIPSSITSIGDGALAYTKIASIDVPPTVTQIGASGASNCDSLRTVVLHEGLKTIKSNAFQYCPLLANISLPASLTNIEGYAFQFCPSLSSIPLPTGLIELGPNAFANCTSLTSIVIPPSFKALSAAIFQNCSALTSVVLPAQLETFASSIFTGCSSLNSVSIDATNKYFSTLDGALFNKAMTILIFCPTGQKGTYTIPSSVKVIDANALLGCTGLTAIDFGSSTPTTFGNYAFRNCIGLKTITIPASVTLMPCGNGGSVFEGCTNLKIAFEPGSPFVNVDGVIYTSDMKRLIMCPSYKTGSYKIPDGVERIDDGAFCVSSLTSISMPSSVTSMGSWTFLGSTNLTSITLSSGLKKLPWQCLFGCPQLKSVVVPAGVTELEQGVFYNDYALKSVTLPEGLTRIGNLVFQGCLIDSLVLPKSLKTVGVGAFGEDFLLSIEFPEGFERFDGDGVFWNQVRTIKMNNPNPIDLTMALGFASASMKNNGVLIVPTGSKAKYQSAPGWSTFKNIIEESSLVELTITSTAGGLSNAIRAKGINIINVKKLIINGNINAFDFKMMRDSMLTLSDLDLSAVTIDAITTATTLGTSTFNVTYSANAIPTNAFLGCKRLVSSIILPNNCTSIDASAFYSARGVKSVFIPASVTSLVTPLSYDNFVKYTVDPANASYVSEESGIYNKSKTAFVVMSNPITGSYTLAPTVLSISDYAFYGSRLTSINIPAGIKNAGYYAFSGSTILSYVCESKTPPVLNSSAFNSINGGSKLYVPVGTKALYTATSPWSSFGTSRIIEMASVEKNIAAGGLEASLTSAEKIGLVKLKLTGQMDARDFKYIRDSLSMLTTLNLSGVTVEALLNSTQGTAGSSALDYPANEIPAMAFKGKSIIDSLYLPSIVQSIGSQAFSGCLRLAYMPLPSTITKVDSLAFASCDKLTEANLTNVTNIANSAFSGCTSLKSVVLDKLETLGTNVFSSCASLNNVTLPTTLKSIPDGTFSDCRSLAKIGMDVTAIGVAAFSGCTALPSVDLTNVTSLGASAFSACSGLKSVVLPNIEILSEQTFSACTGLTTFTIPSAVKQLSPYSFLNCSELVSVTIPKTVQFVAPTAFQGCYKLNLTMEPGGSYYMDADGVIFTSSERKTLVSCPSSKKGHYTIPASVTEIRPRAFESCVNLVSVDLPSGLTTLADSVFMNCSSLDSIALNSGLTSIGNWAFGYCVKLVNIQIPTSVSVLGKSAFENCNKLENINIPSAVTVLNNRLFANCFRLLNFSIPPTITTIGSEVFIGYYAGSGVNLGNLVIPEATVNIAQDAFKNANIATITALNMVPVVFAQSNVFNTVSKKIPLYVPVGTATAYRSTAQWNEFNFIFEPSELTVAVTPGELKNVLSATQKMQVKKLTLTGTMDARDFQTMKNELLGLTDVDLSGTSIVAYVGTEGTGGITSQSYAANTIPTLAMSARYKTVILPTNVLSIGVSAFNGCTLITSMELPATLQSIQASAFQSCVRLSEIKIPSAVTSIGDAAFSDCSCLTKLTIPDGTTSIGASTFQNCINLKTIGLPSTILSIGAKAFMSCEKLKSLMIYSNVNAIGGYAFANCAGLDTVFAKPIVPIALGINTGTTPYVFYGTKSTCSLRVPENSKAAYLLADQWKDFGTDNIIEEIWYGKRVIYSFTGYTPVVRRGDGKVVLSGSKVDDGDVLTINGDHAEYAVQTLKTNPLGSTLYTYYTPKSQTTTNVVTDVKVTDDIHLDGLISSYATWTGATSTDWNTADNWSSHSVPNSFENVLVEKATNTLFAGDLSTCHDLTIHTGSVTIPAAKMLAVTGKITNQVGEEGLIVKADETGVLPNGTLTFMNAADSPVLGMVEMYSKSTTDLTLAPGSKFKWQHFGIPIRTLDMSSSSVDGLFIREYQESGTTIANQWAMKTYTDQLRSFAGYELAPNDHQTSGAKYRFSGILENRDYQSGSLGFTTGALNQGNNLLANPYTAAINLSGINYGADMIQTVYMYSAGTLNDWSSWSSVDPKDTTNTNLVGQYVAVPKLLSGVGGLPSTIPSMQAFVVRANGLVDNKVEIPYSVTIKNSELQRIPRKRVSSTACTQILVSGLSKKSDCMWLFSNTNCTHDFDNGYDGEKMFGSALSPQLYAAEATGKYQVNSVNSVNNTVLGFKAGSDTTYTLKFIHDGNVSARYAALYLVDMVQETITDISASGATYTFSTSNQQAVERFKIVTSTDGIKFDGQATKKLHLVYAQNQLLVQNTTDEKGSVEVYTMTAQPVQKLEYDANSTTSLSLNLPDGVYIVKAMNTNGLQATERMIIKH